MYLLKVVEYKRMEETEQEITVGIYSTQFVRIEKNLITLIRLGTVYDMEHPDTVTVPKEGKVYIMDGEGNTLDIYWP